jgi:hypothetical protein
MVQSQPGHIVHETLILRKKKKKITKIGLVEWAQGEGLEFKPHYPPPKKRPK